MSVLFGRIQSIQTSGLEFVLNQTTDVSGAASTTVFNRWYAQTQRDEAVVLNNARQHREELANEAKRQNGGGRGREVIPPGEAMTSSRSKGLPDDGCRPLRRGLGHREHGGPFPLLLPVIMPSLPDLVLPQYLQERLVRKQAQQRLFRECDSQ